MIYRTKEDRGYAIEAHDDPDDNANAIIRVMRGDQLVREFKVWAYKVFNYGAHASDIIDSEIAGNTVGHEAASSTFIPAARER